MMREKIFWKLLSLADAVSDVAFALKNKAWRWFFVGIANGIDRLAGHAMTEEMRQRPAIAADRQQALTGHFLP